MTAMVAATKRVPISALPLPPPSALLINNLNVDLLTPSITAFRCDVLPSTPSIQRRARLLNKESHFSFVSPFPFPFPYNIPQKSSVEQWLSQHEAVHERPLPPGVPYQALRIYDRKLLHQKYDLLGISPSAFTDCFPNLDVGDAFDILGPPCLSESPGNGDNPPSDSGRVSARQELIDVLSGHSVLMSPLTQDGDQGSSHGFAPWSLRYSGHQFGTWAGQLGDGRAISILVSPHPSDPELSYEIQLKGAGRTPFSRMADGLAVVRSSVREYLCSEALQALSIPTTRALALVALPGVPVVREQVETAAIVSRVAPSFLRIGSFEALNGPTNISFFGGGQQDSHYDALRVLGEWVTDKVLKIRREPGEAWGRNLLFHVARSNAKMVAAWQAYGFMHGVINTDNVSVLGLTIDYGPFSFMDVYDPLHICNHSDEHGRYAYKYQPDMIIFALRALLDTLSPLIGAEFELGNKAVSQGWADDVSEQDIEQWKKSALQLRDELETFTRTEMTAEYEVLMRKRLALLRADPMDQPTIFKPLLDIMQEYRLDFHSTFRTLTKFRPSMLRNSVSSVNELRLGLEVPSSPSSSPGLQQVIARLLASTPDPGNLDYASATQDWLAWMERYSYRIENERSDWKTRMTESGPRILLKDRLEEGAVGSSSTDDGVIDDMREQAGRGANPRFVLRQWVLEEVIQRVESDLKGGRRVLGKVMHMACNPFEPWGGEDDELGEADLDAEAKEERRFCGLGHKNMLGFQCSCSS